MSATRNSIKAAAETPEEQHARELRMIEEAEALADAGLLIPFADVRAWVESWGGPNELPKPTPRKG